MSIALNKDQISKLETEREEIEKEVAELKELLEPPVPPNILTPGVTKKHLEAYDELKSAYDKADKEAMHTKVLKLLADLENIDSQIKAVFRAEMQQEFKSDCDRVNGVLDQAWSTLEELVSKYEDNGKINEYINAYGAGNPLMLDMHLKRLRLDFPKVCLKSNRIKVCKSQVN